MKTKYLAVLLLPSMLFLTQFLYADSPLTSTGISAAYKDSKIVQMASKTKGELTVELMNYLIKSKNPTDVKIAVINELGWDFDGKNNSATFFDYLKKKKKYKNEDDFLRNGSADLLICMAYLKALDDYFDVEAALTFAQKAKEKNGGSYTIQIMCALIEAQRAMDSDWCEVYNLTNNVRINESLKRDMRQDAMDIIFEYMDLYKDECK
ncbi:MAG: hypothetical protein R3C61_27710 [Bacteroidia bacterium]